MNNEMKKLSKIIILLFLLCSCNQADTPQVQIETISLDSQIASELSSSIKALCDVTGLINDAPMINCLKAKEKGYTYYSCQTWAKFSNEGSKIYHFKLDKNKRVIQFAPLPDQINFYKYQDHYNLLPQGQERKQVLDRINSINTKLGLKYYGKESVEKAGKYYRLTFYALPTEEIRKRTERGDLVLDPIFTFYLSEDMTVFAAICKGYCFWQMEKD